MRKRVRDFPWHSTRLGGFESWPHELRTSVGVCLETGFPTCIFWTRDCVHIYNDKYSKFLQRRSVDAFGREFLEVWPARKEELQALVEQVFSGKAVHHTNRPWIHDEEGSKKEFFTISTSPIRNADGQVVGMYQTAEETTESLEIKHLLKQTEAALVKNERLAVVGRLASSIAHEINNPLESVTNLLYLARGAKNPEQVREYLAIAEKEVSRIAEITTQTLRFHRQSNRPRAVSCGSLLEPMVIFFRSVAATKGIEIEVRNRALSPFLCFDGEIAQVLINLIGNAIDAMHTSGGRLLLRAREGTEWRTGRRGVFFTVADTGTGIPREIVRRVFDPFFTTKGSAGSGIGLWISREMTIRHAGRLRLKTSQRKGHSGSTFSLFLPFEAATR